MDLLERFRRWKAASEDRRIDRLTSSAVDLREDEYYDLYDLYRRRIVRARATGQTIMRVSANVENCIRKRIHVIVKPGTYFVSRGGHQNMVTRKEYTFNLEPLATRYLDIDAACINASLAIPGEKDRFSGVARVSKDVARFLDASQDSGAMVVQAGVWALTDNYTGHDIQRHLVARDEYGHQRQVVSDADIAEARRILNRLGIHHRL